jgi:ribosome maturation factor RimP
MANTLKNEISRLAETVLGETDFFLVDIAVKGANPPEVRVYADGGERGINMDECEEISQELGFLMDAHELFTDTYRLIVSSPGMKFSLVDKRQFPKNKGRKIKLKFKDDQGYHKCKGILHDLTDHEIIVNPDNNEPFSVLFNQIVEARVIPAINKPKH